MEATDFPQVLRKIAERYAALLASTLGERLVSVVLFGSVARGDASPGSDIDLLIVAQDLPRGQFARKRLLSAADQGSLHRPSPVRSSFDEPRSLFVR